MYPRLVAARIVTISGLLALSLSACVERAIQPPANPAVVDASVPSPCTLPGQFTLTNDVAVDSVHAQSWQRGALASGTLSSALAGCASLSLQSVGGWRVPTLADWKRVTVKCGLLNAGHAGTCTPCVDQEAFPPEPSDSTGQEYWTADVLGPDAQSFDTFSGRAFRVAKDASLATRCVRDGQN
jgi:hypothetical protein